jgi:hypothetical protein
MSQAFIRHDEETEAFKGDLENLKKLRDWLKIQEKKKAALETPESAVKIDPATREKWLREVIADIEKTRIELDKMEKSTLESR